MRGRFEGKVAVVTGGARGLGEQVVRTLVAEGCRVLVGDVLDDLARGLAEDLGESVVAAHLDVTSPSDWRAIVEDAHARFGGVDVLVNNAALYRRQALEDELLADLDRILAVNLHGPLLGIQAVAPSMRARGGGAIVNVSSLAGTTAYPGHGSYGMSKWAVRGLTRTAAIELAPSRIRVNAVLPGNLRTSMSPTTASGDVPSGLKRQGAPEEVANVIAFLASEQASFINGTDVVADGGSLLG